MASKSINLWFGEDDFSMAEKVKKEKEKFKKNFPNGSIESVDWDDRETSEQDKLLKLQNSLMANSLFSLEKLLIIKNVIFPSREKISNDSTDEENAYESAAIKKEDEVLLKYLEKPQESNRIIFIEKHLDKRKKIYNKLQEMEKSGIAEIKEFKMPVNFYFNDWIKERVKHLGGKVSKENVNYISLSLGKGLSQKDKKGNFVQAYNLWEAKNEIEKLVNYCEEKEIEKEDINLLVKSKLDMNVFSLIDSIGSGNKAEALNLLNAQIEKGTNEIYLLSMFAYQFRNLIRIKSLTDRGFSEKEISGKAKMNPFVIRKSLQQCRRFEKEKLKKIYRKIYDADVAIKTGKIEPKIALNLLVISIS